MNQIDKCQVDVLVDAILTPGVGYTKKCDAWQMLVDCTSFITLDIKPKERALYYKHKLTAQAVCRHCKSTNVNLVFNVVGELMAKCCSLECKVAETKKVINSVDPVTGLTKAQARGLKIKKSLNAINSETGLTVAESRGIKVKESLAKIDPETGLTIAQIRGSESKQTMSKIDPESGLTGHQQKSLKAKQTLSKIDPETGLTGYQSNTLKIRASLSKIDPETGLTGDQSNGKKVQQSLSVIDENTGLTKAQLGGLKSKRTKSVINPETGMSVYDQIAYNRKAVTYERIVAHNAEFTIITPVGVFASNNRMNIIEFKCNKCDTVRKTAHAYIRCLECTPYSISIPEKEVFEFCSQFTDDLEGSNRRLIQPLEVDIYSEKHKLAIEFDGIYWHSSGSVVNEKKLYHLEKTQLCEEQDIQLLHVFENEWALPEKRLILKSIIRNKFGKSNRIFARKCVIKSIDSKTTKLFLENNHLQGSCPSSINYGLYYNDELASLMAFGKSRYNKKYEYELLRFCNTVDTSVVGGASRLFKQFIKNHEGSVISYADKRRSNGNLYKQLGFELSHETEPNYFYVDVSNPSVLHSRVKFQKHKLPGLLEIFDKSKTESENMYANGYRKIFDCGNYVFVYVNIPE